MVDNTFCLMVVTPTCFGADVVLHSRPFVSGASDIIGGAIRASQELIGRLVDVNSGPLMLLGPTMEPKNAFELKPAPPRAAHGGARASRRVLRAKAG
ncbi:MAG: PLP-dependent transferase [Candidatus Eisenbacteria bacterium]